MCAKSTSLEASQASSSERLLGTSLLIPSAASRHRDFGACFCDALACTLAPRRQTLERSLSWKLEEEKVASERTDINYGYIVVDRLWFSKRGAQPGWHMRWFSAFINEVAIEREYKQTFDRALTNLFDGFPGDLLASLKRDVDLDDLMRLLRADGNTARESSVYAAITLVSVLVGALTDTARTAAIEALKRHDNQNSVYRGFHYMLHVAEQLGAKPALLSRLSYEMIGQLHGLSADAIQAWWTEAEVPRLLSDDGSARDIAQRFAPTTNARK